MPPVQAGDAELGRLGTWLGRPAMLKLRRNALAASIMSLPMQGVVQFKRWGCSGRSLLACLSALRHLAQRKAVVAGLGGAGCSPLDRSWLTPTKSDARAIRQSGLCGSGMKSHSDRESTSEASEQESHSSSGVSRECEFALTQAALLRSSVTLLVAARSRR